MTETKDKKTEAKSAPVEPRATDERRRIDFNDPTLTGSEAVVQNLKKQG